MKHVVVHHAHHPDEGVYRLVFAEAHEYAHEVIEPNPEWSEDSPEDVQQYVSRAETGVVTLNRQDVVWDAGDSRWADRAPEDIAAEQRQIVKEAIAARRAEASAPSSGRMVHFDGVGTEL